jgi:hypothetical protein
MTYSTLRETPATSRSKATVDAISVWWAAHKAKLLLLACVVMGVLAALKLGDEFQRLLLDPTHQGAIDIRNLQPLVNGWFSGRAVYEELVSAVHPPATYVLLWPLLGWLDLTQARWLWAITSVLSLSLLVYLIVQESGATTRVEYVFVALLALSMNATGVTIGNGQVILHILPALLVGLLWLHRSQGSRRLRLAAAGLLLFTLAKPTISAPFLWIVLLSGGGLLITLLVLFGYVGATLFALPFQSLAPKVLAQGWAQRATTVAATGGYANVHRWLAYFELRDWIFPVSLLAFAALGIWVYRYRWEDIWILLGVTAVSARLWTYHRVYDDVLILLPMVALFRIAKSESSLEATRVAAGLLLAATVLAMVAPARLEHAGWPWSLVFTVGHALVWLAVLGFLVYQAWRDKKAEV